MSYLEPPPMPAPVVVMKDVGGLVTDYQARTELYRLQNREVKLHECRSACTLALSLPNVCVYPDSTLKFHQAYNDITKEVDHGVSAQLWSSYPQSVRDKLGTLTRQYKVLRGAELIAAGVRNCNAPSKPPEIMIAKATPAPMNAQDGEFFKGVQSAVSTLFGAETKLDVKTPPRTQVANRPPVPPPAAAAPAGAPPAPLQANIEAPLPPSRPPMIGALPTPMPPIPKSTPAYLRPIHGSAPILETRFVPLKVALARLASAGR
ncbi:MAG: hypothetical protein U1E28_20780 [Beijerinckiaceae bacterium]